MFTDVEFCSKMCSGLKDDDLINLIENKSPYTALLIMLNAEKARREL